MLHVVFGCNLSKRIFYFTLPQKVVRNPILTLYTELQRKINIIFCFIHFLNPVFIFTASKLWKFVFQAILTNYLFRIILTFHKLLAVKTECLIKKLNREQLKM